MTSMPRSSSTTKLVRSLRTVTHPMSFIPTARRASSSSNERERHYCQSRKGWPEFGAGKERSPEYPPEGARGQSRSEQVWRLCRDRGRAGSRPLVFPGRRCGGHNRQNDLGLRHDRERRDLRAVRSLREPEAPAKHVGPRVSTVGEAAGQKAGRQRQILCLCRYRGGTQLPPAGEFTRVAGDSVPDSPTGKTVPDHHSCAIE